MNALICGVGGQDGSYLARLLLSKGYGVWGTTREVRPSALANLSALGIADQVNLITMAPGELASVASAIEASKPDEIYNLAGQSSVGLSFEQPRVTMDSIILGTLNVLECIRSERKGARFFNAGSGECFGDTANATASEKTPFNPTSPYAIAKAAAYWLVRNYRQSYGIYATTGILFNHESPFRPQRFVTQKIVQAARRIALGSPERLVLGRLDMFRDWGWAPEYVEAIWRMQQLEIPQDFVIATGEANSLEDFVAAAFSAHDLDWKKHVDSSKELHRPSENWYSVGNPSKASSILDWRATFKMADVVAMMSTMGLSEQQK